MSVLSPRYSARAVHAGESRMRLTLSVPLPADVERRLLGRRAGRVRLHLVDDQRIDTSFDDLATEAGLHRIGSEWHEVDTERAEAVLTQVLHRDLAYRAEVMPLDHAASLARALIAHCGQRARFATNTESVPGEMPLAWFPATDATFDCGVLIIGDRARAVYWVEDED